MSIKKLFYALFALIACMLCLQVNAQVTTATMNGKVINSEGKALAGASVKISFAEAGINKSVITQSDGSYLVPNLRVGGPYKISVSYTGFQEKTEDNIFLELGQNTALDFTLDAK